MDLYVDRGAKIKKYFTDSLYNILYYVFHYSERFCMVPLISEALVSE